MMLSLCLAILCIVNNVVVSFKPSINTKVASSKTPFASLDSSNRVTGTRQRPSSVRMQSDFLEAEGSGSPCRIKVRRALLSMHVLVILRAYMRPHTQRC